MKVQQCSQDNNVFTLQHNQQHSAPNFKGGGMVLNTAGSMMQWIQDKGFLASFLIQDGLGMTAPRVGAAFLRDKEVTGEYNVQEGFEVLGREGLTGPCMMAVAPIMFAIAARFGRTTSVNSQLIRRFGNSLKDLVSKPETKNLLKDSSKFKEHFFRTNIENILENTVGKENVSEESIKYIMEQVKNYQNIPAKSKGLFSKSKHKSECISKIVEYINNLKYNTSTELDMLGKVRVGVGKDIKAFSTKDAIEGMIKYSDDAITLNKHLENLDSAAAENLRDSSLAKRFFANISTIAATLGVLSVLPKIYARSNIAPGAKTAMQMRELNKEEQASTNKENVTFKSRGAAKPSILSKIGKFLRTHRNEKYSSELEYNGHNFTNTLMAGLSLFGLLAPRGLRAYNRAQTDENGKKDLTELYEILIRDISSSLAVVFAVPMLTRAFVSSYEKTSGFVLMQKDRGKSGFKTAIDLLNPYSSAHVLSNSEIEALYHNVDSKSKMVNFCEYISKNDGDLYKILTKSDAQSAVFNENGLNLSGLEKLSKAERNNKITEHIKKLGEGKNSAKKEVDNAIKTLMQGVSGKPKNNKIFSFARGLNSIPAAITLLFISPFILGWIIPRLTYANTRRLHAKAEQERKEKVNVSA